MINPYIGQESQLYGIEEHRLVGGKGDGMRLLEIRNGHGMELTISLDRCCDIARLTHGGVNMSYFSPCGYVAPAFYQPTGSDWLKSFTAGFLTTCGLEAVGSPCTDAGKACRCTVRLRILQPVKRSGMKKTASWWCAL